MVYSTVTIRSILLYEFKNGRKAVEAARLIRNAFGDDSVTDPVAWFWFRRFKSGNEELEDEAREARPLAFSDDDLRAYVKENLRVTCEEIGNSLNCDESTARKRLHVLGFVNKLDKWVPHRL